MAQLGNLQRTSPTASQPPYGHDATATPTTAATRLVEYDELVQVTGDLAARLTQAQAMLQAAQTAREVACQDVCDNSFVRRHPAATEAVGTVAAIVVGACLGMGAFTLWVSFVGLEHLTFPLVLWTDVAIIIAVGGCARALYSWLTSGPREDKAKQANEAEVHAQYRVKSLQHKLRAKRGELSAVEHRFACDAAAALRPPASSSAAVPHSAQHSSVPTSPRFRPEFG